MHWYLENHKFEEFPVTGIPSSNIALPDKWVWECNLKDWNSKALQGGTASTLLTCPQNFCAPAP